MKKLLAVSMMAGVLISCNNQSNDQKIDLSKETSQHQDRSLAKYEPEDGKVLLFAGQELKAVGGVKDYSDGYLDHFRKPAGWTSYTFFMPDDTATFGFRLKGMDGVFETDDWGMGQSNMSMQIADTNFNNMALAIGLHMVNNEGAVARGERDDMIDQLGEFIKSLAPRPVFLRTGYEFDGHPWNHYDREDWLAAYKRIKDRYDEMGITNIAYVWQSTGFVSDHYMLEAWYPGDDYVDWCGFSFFSRWKEQEMIEFARKKGKPVFIAEATPMISDFTDKFDGKAKETRLGNQAQAEEAWERWFVPFFKTIDDNPDVVKAISYINCDWTEQPAWMVTPNFSGIDARLHINETVKSRWEQIIYSGKYIHASENLYDDLLAGE